MTRAFANSPFRLAAILGLLGLAACSYRAGYGDNPFTRSFSWYSYLNGDDLRAYCRGGGPDRYRIVYNGVWEEQVRTYDITADPDRGGGDLVVQVSGPPDLSQEIPLDDLLAPWRGKIVRDRIGRGELRAVRDALRTSGFDTPPPEGTRLQSWSFFWIAIACEGGRFKYNAWGYPSERFERVTLRPPLEAVDRSGVPFNPPRPDTEPERSDDTPGRRPDRYQLVVTPDGISGHFTAF